MTTEGHSIAGAVEVATAIHALRPGHVTPGQLRTVLVEHLTIDTLIQLAALSQVMAGMAANIVDALLANPEVLAACQERAAGGDPLTAAELGLSYAMLLQAAGIANARHG